MLGPVVVPGAGFMLKTILIVTIMAANLPQVEQAYRDELDYRVAQRGAISSELANAWHAQALTGRDYVMLQPVSAEPVYLRFIEETSGVSIEPMKTEGWNAVEILVQDPDALARSLDRSDRFSVVGPPRYLTDKKNIKAMQALGPAGELIYFTNISDPEKSGFGLRPATSYVDRVFIMVVGARDHFALGEFYRAVLGMTVTAPMLYRIGVLSEAYGLPPETRHELSIAQLSERFLIELDRYPEAVKPRVAPPGSLPAGIAMVTFKVTAWQPDLPYLAAPAMQSSFPYRGRRAGVIIGAGGEYIELVASATVERGDAATD